MQLQLFPHTLEFKIPLGSQVHGLHFGQPSNPEAHWSHSAPKNPSEQIHLPASSPYCIQAEVPKESQVHGKQGWRGDAVNKEGRK